MSLATTGGGGAGGGMGMSGAVMAHQAGPSAVARVRQGPRMPTGDAGAGGPSAVPGNVAALGADQLCDKRLQKLSRKTQHLPVVGVDVGGSGHVCYQAPITDQNKPGVIGLGKALGNDLYLKRGSDDSDTGPYKAVRKYLTKGANQMALLDSHPIHNSNTPQTDDDVIIVKRPHSILGARHCSELDDSLKQFYNVSDDSTPHSAIDNVQSTTQVTLQDQALDGTAPKNDDFDRVSFSVPLHKNKKSLTMLPEEAVTIYIAKSKAAVHQKMVSLAQQTTPNASAKKSKKKGPTQDDQDTQQITDSVDHPPLDEDWLSSVPVALAVPGYASSDSTIEAYKEVILASARDSVGDLVADPSALLFPRSACAVTAALFSLPNTKPLPDKANQTVLPSKLFQNFVNEHERLANKAKAEKLPTEGNHSLPLLVTVGVTAEGLELASMFLVTNPQLRPMPQSCDLPIDEYRYLHCVHRRFDQLNPTKDEVTSLLQQSLEELSHNLTLTLGGSSASNTTPFALLLYGDSLQKMHELEDIVLPYYATNNTQIVDKPTKMPTVHSREDAVAFGAALMGAAACGRASRPVLLSTVCTAAVGVKISYSDEKSVIKTIFDFDRRLPAGPYTLEFSALEAAVAGAHGTKALQHDLDEEEYKKLSKPFQGKVGIPKREEAALALKVQLVQQHQRGGKWVPLGDVIQPLVTYKDDHLDSNEDSDEQNGSKDRGQRIACESATLELRLRMEGIVITNLDQDGVSIVQALKNSRLSTLQWYATLLFCILFFGGFLVKSYWEDAVFQRDTRRVLAFYRRAVPGSMHDGDEHGARYLVYKYRNKKPKLWTRLEKKYGYAIPEDWDAFVAEVEEEKRIEQERAAQAAEDEDHEKDNDIPADKNDEEHNLDDDDTTDEL